jgi:YidC/Oxa1 family membrane protein insertase
MMDKKVILYILLGVIVFALWEMWQKDYGQIISTQNNISTSVVPINIVPTKASIMESVTEQRTIKTVAAIPESRLIRVHTDVLDIAIDDQGGNIVQVDLLKYPEIIYQPKPIRLLNNDPNRYYIAQSKLVGDLGPDTLDEPAQYTSSQREYKLEPTADNLKVKLLWNGAEGVTVTKVFTFAKNKYGITVDYEIDNKSNRTWSGQFYAEVKRRDFDSAKGLFKISTYTGAAVSSIEKHYEQISFSNIEEAAKNKKEFIRENRGGWVAMQQRYFLSAWIPAQDRTYYYFNSVNNGIYTIGLRDNAITVPAGEKITVGAVLYAGPEIADNIAHLAPDLDRTVDYGWLWIISVGFFWVLKNIYRFVGNWGVAIILVTLLIKLVFYKLSESSCRSMAKMRELMPKMQALKERYGDDRQKLHQATMELYKREKVNPLNLGGCLPMIIQIPFFIALYYVLISAIELRHSPFIFWIYDLSAADPYYVLPILMGLSMFLQQRLSPSSADPAQAKMMMFMPVIFTVFFVNFPSGLVLYWLVNNVLSILQQWYINKKLAK